MVDFILTSVGADAVQCLWWDWRSTLVRRHLQRAPNRLAHLVCQVQKLGWVVHQVDRANVLAVDLNGEHTFQDAISIK